MVPDTPPGPGDTLRSWAAFGLQVGTGLIGLATALSLALILFGVFFLVPLP